MEIGNYLQINHVRQVFAYESIIIPDSAIGLTSTIYNPAGGRRAIRAVITVETAPIRYRIDGNNPAADEGHLLNPMSVLVIEGYESLDNVRFIRTGTTSGKIRVSYER